MREWLVRVTEQAVIVIDGIALLVILAGTAQAVVDSLRLLLGPRSGREWRDVWLGYARWLVAGLTFQLASDIIESSIRSSWESIGRLGAIAVIRTFLSYFLERDLSELRARQKES